MATPSEPSHLLFAAGTATYESLPPLPSVRDDLSHLASFFERIGYQNHVKLDPAREDLERSLESWAELVSQFSPAIAVVYLTGHSYVESGGLYLVTADSSGSSVPVSGAVPVNDLLSRLASRLSGTPVLVILDTDSVGRADGPEPFYQGNPDVWILETSAIQPALEGAFVSAFITAADQAISAAGYSLPYVDLAILIGDTRTALVGQAIISLTSVTSGRELPPFIPNPNYTPGMDLDAPTARTQRSREPEMELDAPTARVQGARTSEEPAEAAATPSPPVSLLAGYAADTVAGEDELGIAADVESLCSVLMATQVQPPLSVGLFGDWGAGKSFFMQRMRERIDWLATESKLARDDGRPSAYCENVRQITFNAWHYVDANLWASLITRIFDGLLGGTDDQLEPLTAEQARQHQQQVRQMLARLESSELFSADARRQRDLAERQLQEKLHQQQASSGRLNRLTDLAGKDIRQVAQRNPAEVKQALGGLPAGLEQDLYVLAGTYGLWGTLGEIWSKLGHRARWQTVALAVLAAALIVVGVVVVHSTWRTAPIVVAAGSIAAILARWLPGLRRARAAAQAASQAIDGAIRRGETAATVEAARLQDDVVAARARLEQADAEVAEIQDGRRLGEFIAARAASVEYQQGLGIIALVRRDLARLSRLMSDPDADQAQHIDRIVLYIDDLDRCPAARVAEVLQAVHLLLAFPLFIVVVGADARWLLRSLELQYADLMTADRGPGADEDPEMALHWSATPQNYLDKIFQIPFSLKPMDADGFDRLIRATTGPPATAPASRAQHAEPVASPSQQQSSGTARNALQPPAADSEPLLPGYEAPNAFGVTSAVTRSGGVTTLRFAEEHRLVVMTESGQAVVLGARTGNLAESWTSGGGQLSPDGSLIATRVPAGIRLCEAFSGQDVVTITGEFSAFGFSTDGSWLTTFSGDRLTAFGRDGSVRWERAVHWSETLAEHMSVLPGGHRTVWVADGGVGSYAPESSQPLWGESTGHLVASSFGTDGSLLAVAVPDSLEIFDLGTGTRRHQIPVTGICAVSVNDDSSRIAVARRMLTGGTTGTLPVVDVLVLDAVSGVVIRQARHVGVDPVTAMAFSPNSRLLAAGDSEGNVHVWSLAPPTTNLSGRQLQLTEPELAFLARLSPLIRTPRATKRLVNVYRLLRAPLGETELSQLLGDADTAPEHPAVLLLLTIVTGFPDPAQAVIGGLLEAPGGTWPEFLGRLRAQRHAAADHPGALRWKAFFDAYDHLDLTGMPEPIEIYERWAPRAARYSFRTGRLLG
jgi:KAP-like P-loop domain-containing protein/caspase domain-containing protein/WD40 domain-containing protein